jgi:hypothetical protein
MEPMKRPPHLLAWLGAIVLAGGIAAVVVLAFGNSSSEAAPTKAEYFAGVAKICGAYGPRFDAIAPPSDVTIPGEVVTPLKRVIPLIRAETSEVSALTTPRELAAKIDHWLALKQRVIASLEKTLHAAEAPDIAGTAVAYIRFEKLAGETSRAGAAIGFPSVCSSSS